MGNEGSLLDVHLFNKLEACVIALASSVVEPICIFSNLKSVVNYGKTEEGVIAKGRFSSVFWDVEDCGEGIIRGRLGADCGDISKHHELHSRMQKLFYDIEESANRQNRKEVSEKILELCGSLDEYSIFVNLHQKKEGECLFLFQPTCIPGHYGIRGQNICELSFNPNQTKSGLWRERKTLTEMAMDFGNEFGQIVHTKIYTSSADVGHGTMDSSYRGNLELLRQELKKFDFELK